MHTTRVENHLDHKLVNHSRNLLETTMQTGQGDIGRAVACASDGPDVLDRQIVGHVVMAHNAHTASTTRMCKGCLTHKPTEEFYKTSGGKCFLCRFGKTRKQIDDTKSQRAAARSYAKACCCRGRTKQCYVCMETKPWDEFNLVPARGAYKPTGRCKQCWNSPEWPEKYKASR